MRIIDAISEDLTGSPRVYGGIGSVVAAIGSVAGAARVLGVPRRTLRGWLDGRTPRNPPNWTAIMRGIRVGRHEHTRKGETVNGAAYYDQAYRGDRLLAVKGKIRVSRDIRSRVIWPGRYIPNSVIRRVLDQWSSGDDTQAERTLIKAIDEYYQPMDFVDIVGAWFE